MRSSIEKNIKAKSSGPIEAPSVTKRKSPKKEPSGRFDTKPFPIVALGASAGGIKAFTELLRYLSPDLGMAYVLIMHLSPNHKSALAEIMRSKTKMPVCTVVDGMELKANNIFVIPPNTFMSVVDGHLKLAPRTLSTIGNFVIDFFMTGLAGLYKNNAIGVILSGTATDGTLGLKAIKAEGGITFAQDKSADFNGMPQSAKDSGYVDFNLPPKGIARELKRLTKSTYTNLPSDKIDVVSSSDSNGQSAELQNILSIVRERSGVDFFHHYKQASIYRRVMRRMALNQFEKLHEYGGMLAHHPKEVDALFDDFLINVTSFFRDSDFYETLSSVIFPAIIKDRQPDEPIRIWSAGCATGEEAYSIAICLTEYLLKKRISASIQIFASDLDANAIEKARMGVYPLSALHGVSPAYLARYFKKTGSQYQVVKAIRENCVFSHHNLLKDPPFSRMNLISCQNVLIYLETNPQKKVLQTFHYALKSSGYLFLAKSETIGGSTDLFEPMDKKIRCYARKATKSAPMQFDVHVEAGKVDSKLKAEGQDEGDVERDMGKLMLSRYVHPGVVVNENLVITQFFGQTSPWLGPASGKASFNILKMIRSDLLIEVRSLLQQARKSGQPVTREGIRIFSDKVAHELTIEVVPRQSSAGIFFLVVFKENQVQAITKPEGSTLSRHKARTIAKLESELVQSLEVIRTTTEEYETTYEELQANNEEVLSSNEELQSVNEELETSREELQSSNEELTTINEELTKRNLELKESQDYTEAILETMHGPLMVLSANLQVRKANTAFYQTFQLAPEKTEGSYLYDLADGAWDIPALREHLRDLGPSDSTFNSFELKYFMSGLGERDLTINIYRLGKGANSKENLILLAFEDFTRRYNAEKSLLKTQEQLKLSLIGDTIGTWWWNLKTDEVKWSKENEVLNGLTAGSFRGYFHDWMKLIHPEDLKSVTASIHSAVSKAASHPIELEYRITWPDKSVHWILSKGHVYVDGSHNPDRMVGVSMDNTRRKLEAEHLEHQVELRTVQLTRANDSLVKANRQLEQFVFISNHDLQEPLRKIKTFSNLLEGPEAEMNAYAKKYVGKIGESVLRMSTLLNDLHSFSLLKEDTGVFTSVDLYKVVKSVISNFATYIKAAEATVNLSPLPEVHGDAIQLYQLFAQLLSNALKFNHGKPVVDITARRPTEEDYLAHPELKHNTQYVVVMVQDNGIGFDQKYAHKLFILFQQLKDMPAGGTGIGLAICKKVVDNHRGFLFANGKVKGGSLFTVFLPSAKPED